MLAPREASFLYDSSQAADVDGEICESLRSVVWPSHVPSNSPASSEWCLVSYEACTASRSPTPHTGSH
ncbi:hypothetical protein E2C01_067191 [Portunus trituberculatus]|uniref:Uncharacterized protein n=1 Tax=Portunus trituberculatus TaxID=210409 RepID=A0A5B7HVZ2_PORTR|nr:hypothetical protein [Portunus trituberculatus]